MGALAGWTVVVTRAEEPGGPLGRALAHEGARVLHIPTVTIGPPSDPRPLRLALERLSSFDWLVVTSPRAVAAFQDEGVVLPEGLRVASVGRGTAERLRDAGLRVDVVGSGEGAEALARELVGGGIGPGSQVFFPASSRAGDALVEVLEGADATVERVVAYETRSTSFDLSRWPELSEADVVTFTSPSAVDGWAASFGGDVAGGLSESVRYVAIGETTAAALEERGVTAIRAPDASFGGMVAAIVSVARSAPDTRSRTRS